MELRDVLNARRGSTDPLMEEKVKVLWDTLHKEKPTPSSADLRRSPFAMDLRMQPLPSKFKMPVLEGYDGSKDPMDHLNCFRTHLSLQGASEALMCQCFPVTLRGDTLLWFHGLPPNSIRSFDELADSFLSQFASSRREERQHWHLVRLCQRQDESLKRFLDRFITEARRIPHLSDELKLNAFVATLAAGDFFKHLSHQRPRPSERLRPLLGRTSRPKRPTRRSVPSELTGPRKSPELLEGERGTATASASRSVESSSGPHRAPKGITAGPP
ncbi:hypothetical protein Nepgr_028175 [Nepenthes gracilis]|uniref:Retrotransposon gag domain-containing protein n=1 Tax=Nepenthes gracilis TaxID=150966 RepID=A0AAD3TBG4_NEPGR|nr:hypothetical protein Nepgr_028175 [Nepenthes gracilis]